MSKKYTEKVYNRDEIERVLRRSLPNWKFNENYLERQCETNDWKGTLLLVNAVGHLSEVAWHHPELIANYNTLKIRLNTHDADGVTDRDFALAEKIEELLLWRPGKEEDARLMGTPDTSENRYLVYDD